MNAEFFYANKEFLVSSTVAIACAGFFLFFPTTGYFDTLIASGVFLMGVPLLYSKFILKKKMSAWGLQRGTWSKKTTITTTIAVIVSIAPLFFILRNQDFVIRLANELPLAVFTSFSSFLLYEFLSIAILAFFLSFFLQGFLLTLLREKYGFGAILLQTICANILFFLYGTALQDIPYLLLLSFCAGIIAYYTRSIYYSFALFFLISLSLDITIINMFT